MRPADPVFAPDEPLYRRIKPQVLLQAAGLEGLDNAVLLSDVGFPDFSVNRGKYSNAEDVLQPNHAQCGIVRFLAGDTPGPLTHPGERRGNTPPVPSTFEFRVEDDPIESNEAHAEVRTYQNNARSAVKPPPTLRVEFRELLRRRMAVVRAPVRQ